jgi:hypothetical protein
MTETENIVTETNSNTESKPRSFFSILKLALRWGMITLLVMESLLAGIWTLIPTSLLPWGAHDSNFIGYVSHCSFAPLSTLMLLGITALGIVMGIRTRNCGAITYTIISIGSLGILLPIFNGISIMSLFIEVGAIVVAIVAGVIAGLVIKGK